MARMIKQGQHIFIAFQDGEAVLDSQLRPRMYKSKEQFEKSFPAWRDGKAELVEYAPTLTPPNEPLTPAQLRGMGGSPIVIDRTWGYLEKVENGLAFFGRWYMDFADEYELSEYGKTWLAYRRPLGGDV